MTDIKAYIVSPIFTNCYLVVDKETAQAAVVDPGGKSDELTEYLKSSDVKLKYILLTHGHFDHISYANELAKQFDAEIVCGKNTDKYLSDNFLNLSANHDEVENVKPFGADILLDDGDVLTLGNTAIKFITTPGHTDGCGCYIFDDNILSGDTLFCESYGRTDFSTSSFTDMTASLKKLKMLDGDYNVYPGHGMSTTLNHERKFNPLMSRL